MFPRRIIQQTAPREDYPHQKSPSLISGGTDHHGWGNTPVSEVPNIKFDDQSLEAKPFRIRLHTTQVDIDIIEWFSTYTKLVRVIAYILRFCHNTQSKRTRSYSQLSPKELDNALRCVVKIVQAETFQSDMHAILAENRQPPKSILRNLTPFLDDGILRVRVRLKHIFDSNDFDVYLPNSFGYLDVWAYKCRKGNFFWIRNYTICQEVFIRYNL